MSPFNPKATIAILREERDLNGMLDDADKKLLVERYLEVNMTNAMLLQQFLNWSIFLFLINQFKQLMIRLDPDEEADEDDVPPGNATATPQKNSAKFNNQPLPNTSQAIYNEVDVNHVHLNNVQVNLTKVALPPDVDIENYVSF